MKVILDNWIEDINSDNLIEINGYKIRLLNENDLFDNLGYDKNVTATDYIYAKTEDTPDFVYNISTNYWTLLKKDDNEKMFIIDSYGHIDALNGGPGYFVFYKYAIRPVINLKKCAISN